MSPSSIAVALRHVRLFSAVACLVAPTFAQGTALAQTSDARTLSAQPGAPAAGATDRAAVVQAAEAGGVDEVVLESATYRATVRAKGGGVSEFRLKGDQFTRRPGSDKSSGGAVNIVTTDKPAYLPLTVKLEGAQLPPDARWTLHEASPGVAELTWRGDGLVVRKRFERGSEPYQLRTSLEIANEGAAARELRAELQTFHYVARAEEKGGFFAAPAPKVSNAVCDNGDDTERVERDKLTAPKSMPRAQFAALDNVYFVSAIVPVGEQAATCRLEANDRGGVPGKPHGTLFSASLQFPEAKVEPGARISYQALSYLGPKDPKALERTSHALTRVVNLGVFSKIAGGLVALLSAIHGFVGNWGVAIILLTLLVKLVLFPLTAKSFSSMARLKHLKPELDAINERYKDDREKRGMATMELYRKQKINPVGGCLPQLLQLPIWWALYTSLSTNVELYNAPFALWWTDLSAPDRYFSLPIALGALMIVQQKLTPTTMDPAQAKLMMYMMPAMITSFMLFLPSGLCLYMLTNAALSIVQQKFIERRLGGAQVKAETPLSGRDEYGGLNRGRAKATNGT